MTPGTRLGPYEIVSPLGTGGMGEVYKAKDTRLGRSVAIKVLLGRHAEDPAMRERFEREAQAISALSHPAICTLHDIGEHEGTHYLVMEYLDGETMAARLARGPLPLEEALELGREIAAALAAAHDRGIVHRDLKPGNVMLTKGGPKLLDFGLAKLHAASHGLVDPAARETVAGPLTERGEILGTLQYMAPEQLEGGEADARSDIFAFGCLLYEAISGRSPFAGRSRAGVIAATLKETPARLSQPGREIPPAVDGIIRHCLDKDPAQRFQSMRDLAFDLAAWSGGPSPSRRGDAGETPRRRVMLVVLPFENLSGDPEQEYFSAGLTEETIADLGGLGADGLGVIARTSAMSYKGTRKSITEIGRELGVEFALEGSVRRHAGRVRISVQLIRTSDQTHVWAQRYDRELSDVLAVQDDIGRAIAEQIQVTLSPAHAARSAGVGSVNQAAYDAYLQGRFHLWRVTRPDLERALEHFRRATEIDPSMAVAYAGLAQAYVVLPIAGGAEPRQAFPQAELAAMRALALDPDSAEAQTAMTGLRHWYGWDWAGAEAYARRAITRNPSDARAHQVLGRLLTNIGRHDEAIAEIDTARGLDPRAPLIAALSADFRLEARRYDEVEPWICAAHELDPSFWVAHVSAARLYLHQGRYAQALAAAEKAWRSSGGHSEPLALIGCCHGAMGRREGAEEVLAQLERRREAGYVPATHIATVHLGLGQTGEALRWLERAFADRDVWLTEAGVEPRWDGLRGHRGFDDLVRRIGFPAPPAAPSGESEPRSLSQQ
ncbi:MAG: protein kinase [Thermoanaerobaculaceae bacterium]|nr:protein kinase [Thermoanaerobaculaceae bacterium]